MNGKTTGRTQSFKAAQASDPAPLGSSPSALPRFAANAVNRQVARVSETLTSAAQSIDNLAATVDVPLPDSFKGFATTASQKLRALADRATDEEAGKLIASLQRAASRHPAATAGIGTALGAALGLALTRLARPAPADDAPGS